MMQKEVKTKVHSVFYLLLAFYLLSTIQGLYQGYTSVKNVILSFWLFIPLLYLFLCKAIKSVTNGSFNTFMKFSSKFLLLIDFLGLLWKVKTGGEDEFGFAYGRHYEYVHGLAMINVLYIFYYVSKYLKGSDIIKKTAIKYSLLYFLSFVLCSFGLSFLVLFLTILIAMLLERKKLIIIPFILICALATFIYNSDFFEYERSNIEYAFSQKDNARKMLMFDHYFDMIEQDPYILAFGTGPGGFNSRATVLLDGDSQNIFIDIGGTDKPRFYKKYIYPLWNKSFVSQSDYSDGTRNKPFSSIIAIFAELGFFFGIIICFVFIKRIFYKIPQKMNELEYFILLMDIFMFISCAVHEWFVSTEFIVYLFLRLMAQCNIKNEAIVDNKV